WLTLTCQWRPRLLAVPLDSCRAVAAEDQSQGGAPAAERGRTTLTVIFARRQDARREGTADPRLQAWPPGGDGERPVKAGSWPAKAGAPPRPQGLLPERTRRSCRTRDRSRPATPRQVTAGCAPVAAPGARSVRTGADPGRSRLAPEAPLKFFVEKVVTTQRGQRGRASEGGHVRLRLMCDTVAPLDG